MTIAFIWTLAIVAGIVCFAKSAERTFFGLFAFLAALEVNKITATALMIGSQEINATDIVLAALFLYSIPLLLKRVKVNKGFIFAGVAVISVAIFSLAFNVIWPYDGVVIPSDGSWDRLVFGSERMREATIGTRSYLVLIRLTLFALIAWCASGVLNGRDFLKVGRYALTFGKVQIAYGLFEFFTKALMGNDVAMRFAAVVFPANASVVTDIVVRSNIVTLQAFCREPSHFAAALTFLLLILLVLRANGHRKRFDLVWAAFGLFLLVMSGAFTAIVGLAIVAIAFVYYLRRGNLVVDGKKKTLVYYLFFLIAVTVPIVLSNTLADSNNYYFEKFFGVIANFDSIVNRQYGGALTTFDALPRIASIVECLRVFLDRPVLGIGPGVVNPYSGVAAILSQYGIVFSVTWFVFLYRYSESISENAASGLFIGVVIGSGLFLFGGGYEYSFLWLLLGGLLQNTAIAQENRDQNVLLGGSR